MYEEQLKEISLLAEKLSMIPAIDRLSRADESGGWRVAYSIIEIEESCVNLINEFLPKLKNANEIEIINDISVKINCELSHIHYHINDSKYFKV